MKIAYIVEPRKVIGGGVRAAINLVKAMKQYYEEDAMVFGVNRGTIKDKDVELIEVDTLNPMSMAYWKALKQFLKSYHPDVVHCLGLYSALVLVMQRQFYGLNFKIVCTVHRVTMNMRFRSMLKVITPYIGLDELGKVVDKLGVTHNVIVVVQTEKDYETSQAFAIKHGVKLIKSHNVLELIEVYRNVDLLLGMRLHSIILALSVGTPCLGLFYKQWGLKNPGMMSCFNMPYKFWEDRPTAEDIEQNVQTLIQNKQIHTNTILEIVKKEEHMLKSKISEIVQIPYGGGGKISYINGRSAA